jgi:hypothetical protein
MPAPSGELQLPLRPLDALPLMPKQVEEWLEQMLHQPSAPWLVAIDGTPGREGGTFLYAATLEAPSERGDQLWLQPGIAAAALGGNDNRFLLLCADQAL